MAAKGKPERPKEDRRVRFAHEYAKDFNATQAAIRSGYSAGKKNKSAEVTGCRLLSDVKVQAIIQSLHAQSAVKAGTTVDRVHQEYARVAFSDARKLFRADNTLKPPSEWDDDTAAVLAGIDVTDTLVGGGDDEDAVPMMTRISKVKRWDKMRALDSLAKILGMLKPELPGNAGGGLAITIVPYGAKR
jgi:phage terminase small subunit